MEHSTAVGTHTERVSDVESELAGGAKTHTDRGTGLTVAVVGGGAVGVTAAYDLARQGATVTLYEKGQIASGSSGRAAGLCYDAFSAPPNTSIGTQAIERFRAFSGDDTFTFHECPYVWFAREDDDQLEDRVESIREGIRRMQEADIIALELDSETLRERFPHLRTDDIAVAGIAGAAGYTDPARYTACLAAAANGAGATIEAHTPVTVRADPPRVVPQGDESVEARAFDAVLVAAGAHTKAVLQSAGFSIPLKPYRVQALTATGALTEPMCYDATTNRYVRPHADGILAGNGTKHVEADPDEYDRDATAGFAADLCGVVADWFPSLEIECVRAWAGLCTATPDMQPLVGEVTDGVYVATGFQGEGFMRSPAIGERIADEILGGDGIEAFDPTRFHGDESFPIRDGMAL